MSSQGHSIEKRPTTKISQELYDILCNEFHVDADKKIASQEAVEAKTKEKQEIREKQENLVLDSKKEFLSSWIPTKQTSYNSGSGNPSASV